MHGDTFRWGVRRFILEDELSDKCFKTVVLKGANLIVDIIGCRPIMLEHYDIIFIRRCHNVIISDIFAVVWQMLIV